MAKQKELEEDGQIKKMSLHPAINKIVSLQMGNNLGFYPTEDYKSETDLLKYFWVQVQYHSPIIGFNIINFDLPTIIMRSMLLGITPTIEIPLRRYSRDPVFDVMQELALWNAENWKGLD